MQGLISDDPEADGDEEGPSSAAGLLPPCGVSADTRTKQEVVEDAHSMGALLQQLCGNGSADARQWGLEAARGGYEGINGVAPVLSVQGGAEVERLRSELEGGAGCRVGRAWEGDGRGAEEFEARGGQGGGGHVVEDGVAGRGEEGWAPGGGGGHEQEGGHEEDGAQDVPGEREDDREDEEQDGDDSRPHNAAEMEVMG